MALLADLEVTAGANVGLDRTVDIALQTTADAGRQPCSSRNYTEDRRMTFRKAARAASI